MKRIACIGIVGGNSEWCQELYRRVKDDIPNEWAKKYVYKGYGPLYLPLPDNSRSYNYAIEIAKDNGLHPAVEQIAHYTKSEIEQTEYFQMRILSPLEAEGTEAADYGTRYVGGCSNQMCGLGKKLAGDVLVDRKFLNQKKWDIGTLRPDVYVSEKLKNIICENALTGVSFEHEVKDFKGREMPRFYRVKHL
jgi:hypothetical protein